MSLAGAAVTDFHDVTSGNNGFPAGPGYDLVTGLGTPIGAGTIANLMDDASPTAIATVTNITGTGAQPYSFTVAFSDNHNVKFRTLDSSDIVVQGPSGSIPAAFVSVNQTSDGSLRTATYQCSPPGGSWDSADNGTYSVGLQANQVSDTAGNFAVGAAIGTFNVAVAPSVVSTQINDGSAQRSVVSSVTVTFSAPVDFANNDPSSAFSFIRADNTVVSFTAHATVVSGQIVVVLDAFGGAVTEFGSLADGRYTLTALASQISANGQQMASDYSLRRRPRSVSHVRRREWRPIVNGLDFGFFKNAFGTQVGDANYLSYLDFNGDGVINGFDFGQFRTRFGTTLP